MGALGWTENTYQVNLSIIPVDKVSKYTGRCFPSYGNERLAR